MNVNNLKKPQKRFSTRYLSSLGIQQYGEDNQYPQRVADVIDGSSIGGTCLERYATFIEGNGFDNVGLSNLIVNRRGETCDDLLHLIVGDLAKYGGFALHLNYNTLGKVVEVQHVHFEDCRLCEEDDFGYVPFIAVHPDWTGQKTRNGKTIRVNRENVRYIYPFNPNPAVIAAQIAQSGGIENYCGQILWVSKDGKNQYPRPIYDKVITALSTDEGIDNVLYRNARNNFMTAGAFAHRKGNPINLDDNGNAVDADDDTFGDSLNEFLGDTNAASIMDITYENVEDKPEFIAFRGTNYDGELNNSQANVTEKIYSAFQQEAWYCIRIGKVGFGGDVIEDAYKVYNSIVATQRRIIQRAFARVFKSWGGDAAIPDNTFEIQPLVLVAETETTNATETETTTTTNPA